MASLPSFWRKKWFLSWFNARRPARQQKKQPRRAFRSFRLERLEDRTLLTTVTLTATSLAANAPAIVISGSGFDPIVANNSVVFNNGATGTITSASSNSLTVQFANAPTAGNLTANVTSDGASSGAVQVASVTPVVTSSTDHLAVNAGTITIDGFGFDTSSNGANNTLAFSDGAAGTVTAATATTLTVSLGTAPTTAGPITVDVTTGGQDSGAVTVATVTPVITSSAADVAVNAGTITINGFGFDASSNGANNTLVFSDGAAGTVTAATATALTVSLSTAPTTAGPLTAVVTTDSAGSGSPVQVATITPVVTTITSDLAANAHTLTIQGFGFDTTVGNNTVTLDDGAAGTVTAATSTRLTVTLSTDPTTAGELDASVATDTLSSGAEVQVATVTPVVTSSTLAMAAGATTLTIDGYGFDTTSANDALTLSDGTVGSISVPNATSIVVTFSTGPSTVGSLTAQVTADLAASGPAVQVATVTPVVLTNAGNILATNAGSVTIIGLGFDTGTFSNNSVTFNDGAVAGSVTGATATTLTVALGSAPTTAGSLTAVVTTDGVASGSAIQVGTVKPAVTSSVAGLAANASTLSITGSGFDPTIGNDSITFNDGAVGTVTAATPTSLTVALGTDPTSAGNLTAQVSVDGVGSGAAVQVATVTPVVTSSTANLAPNAATVTISGYGFNATTPSDNTVTFSGAAVGTVTAATATRLTVTFATEPTAGNLTASVASNGQSSGAARPGSLRRTGRAFQRRLSPGRQRHDADHQWLRLRHDARRKLRHSQRRSGC